MDIDFATDAAKPQNEDHIGRTDSAVWVLDGATGLTDDKFSPDDYETDGAWFVRYLTGVFNANLPFSGTLREHVELAMRDARDAYEEMLPCTLDEVSRESTPSAGLVMLRESDRHLEYYNLGDCSLVIETREGDLIHIRQPGPRPLDNLVVEMMDNADGGEPFDRSGDVNDRLREHRNLKNSIDGYWAVDVEPLAAYNGTQGRISKGKVRRAILFSDGYEPLVDDYDAFDSWAAVMNHIDEVGLDDTIARLRAVEEDDPEGDAYPRLKRADDAAVAYVRL